MDVKNLSAHLNYFSSKGIIFSLETKALLLNSLTCAKKAYKFVSMQFWGKVETLKESYYIVIGTKADGNTQTIYSVNILEYFRRSG